MCSLDVAGGANEMLCCGLICAGYVEGVWGGMEGVSCTKPYEDVFGRRGGWPGVA